MKLVRHTAGQRAERCESFGLCELSMRGLEVSCFALHFDFEVVGEAAKLAARCAQLLDHRREVARQISNFASTGWRQINREFAVGDALGRRAQTHGWPHDEAMQTKCQHQQQSRQRDHDQQQMRAAEILNECCFARGSHVAQLLDAIVHVAIGAAPHLSCEQFDVAALPRRPLGVFAQDGGADCVYIAGKGFERQVLQGVLSGGGGMADQVDENRAALADLLSRYLTHGLRAFLQGRLTETRECDARAGRDDQQQPNRKQDRNRAQREQ